MFASLHQTKQRKNKEKHPFIFYKAFLLWLKVLKIEDKLMLLLFLVNLSACHYNI